MPCLPVRPDLDQLRHQAKDLLHAAQRGDPDAVARIQAVSSRVILSSAQLALAREYGFASWARLKLEVERRDVLNSRDPARLSRLLAEHPELATAKMEHWRDHKCADPVGYMAMLRFDARRLGLPRAFPGCGTSVLPGGPGGADKCRASRPRKPRDASPVAQTRRDLAPDRG